MMPANPPAKAKNITLWIFQILMALVFLAAGIPKLMGVPAMVDAFTKIGWGLWFLYVTGILEILGAIGLVIPRFTFYAALLLATIMFCAVIFCFVLHQSPVAAAVCFVITAAIAYFRRP